MQPGLGTYEYPLQAADARDYCLTDVCLNLTPQAAAQGGAEYAVYDCFVCYGSYSALVMIFSSMIHFVCVVTSTRSHADYK